MLRRAIRGGGAMLAHAADLARCALPQRCELCAAPSAGVLLCPACSRALPRARGACPRCALPSPDSANCGECVSHPPPQAATIAAFVYAFPVDRLLQRMKYSGRLALADWAGVELAAAIAGLAAAPARSGERSPEAIVALPLSAARQRERGYNQAREIAVRIARTTGLPLAAPLARVGGGPPQAALTWAARLTNVHRAFAVRDDVRGARLALVDDVMTTGATLAEASRALLDAGAARVECWVVARTPPPAHAPP